MINLLDISSSSWYIKIHLNPLRYLKKKKATRINISDTNLLLDSAWNSPVVAWTGVLPALFREMPIALYFPQVLRFVLEK